jgi:chromosomal replication initiation ATPase DnaA
MDRLPRGVEQKLELCDCMIDIASALFNVSGRDLRHSGRSSHAVARVRQIAMYVSHVVLGLTMNEVGRGFGRDRTTVLHACHLVEDMREDLEFDRIVAMTERVAGAALRNSRGGR